MPVAEPLDTKNLLKVLAAVRKGDFTVRMPVEMTGLAGKVSDTLNDVIELNARMVSELERLSSAVGREGKVNHRVTLGAATGSWAVQTEYVNTVIAHLVQPTTETARVINAVAKGDLTQTMATEIDGRALKGDFLRTARIVNRMVEQLSAFASEVTRVAREVGQEGRLGVQAHVKDVAGTWKD